MGAQHSRPSEPVIIYNQSSPLQFSSLKESNTTTQTKKEPVPITAETNEKIDQLVRERVLEHIRQEQEQQEKSNQRSFGQLAKQNIQNDHNSVAMTEDINNMIEKLQRSAPAEIPTEVSASQEALIVCYKKNHTKPLDCWQEVEQFKNAVAVEQKKFVAAHQR